MTRWQNMALVTLLAAFLAGSSSADVVVVADGSRIVGKITRVADGKVTIATEFAGELTVDLTKVTGFATDDSVNVQLSTGDKLVGTMSEAEAGSVVEGAIGPVNVEADKVTAIWRPGEDSPEVASAKVEAAKEAAKYKPDWSATVEAGWQMTEGNTETVEARGRAELRRKTADDLLKFYASADYREEDDRRTRNEYIGGVYFEDNITERWLWYARSELEHDEFENLDLRATIAGGLGYYWIRQADHELKTRAGVGYRHESYEDDRTTDDVILDLGLDYRLDIRTWAQFTHSTTYSPSIDEFNDYRLALDTALAIPLAHPQWKLKLGMRNDYNSRPAPGLERLDNTYYANIAVDIK